MALIKCSECGKNVSDKAKVCIHCGAPIEEVKKNNTTKVDKDNKIKKIDDTENEIVNNAENSKGNNAAAIITLIFAIVCFVYGAYKLDWLTFLGINTAGINGCYYQDDEDNGGLCFDGKEAYFTFDKETIYYVNYIDDYASLEDKYGDQFTTCQRVKDSSDIKCGSLVLHKQ